MTLGADRLKHLVPALCSLEASNACRGVVPSRVNYGVFGKNGDSPIFSSRADDCVIGATVSSFADGSSTWDVGPETGLIPSVERAGSIGSDSLPGGMGVPGFLHGDDGSIVICPKGSNGGPVGLEAGDVEVDKVDSGSRAVSIGGARVGPTDRVNAQGPLLREDRALGAIATAKEVGWLWRG